MRHASDFDDSGMYSAWEASFTPTQRAPGDSPFILIMYCMPRRWVEIRRSLLRDCPIEHSADDRAVEIRRGNAKADDAAREYVHHDHDPEAPEQNRFAAKQVDAPQAVRGVPDHGEPRRVITTWQRSLVLDEYATHDIVIDLDTERARYLLGIFRQPKRGLRRFISTTVSMSSLEGSLGPGRRRFLEL